MNSKYDDFDGSTIFSKYPDDFDGNDISSIGLVIRLAGAVWIILVSSIGIFCLRINELEKKNEYLM